MKKEVITLFAIFFSVLAANGQDFGKRIDYLVEKAVNINRFNGSVRLAKTVG